MLIPALYIYLGLFINDRYLNSIELSQKIDIKDQFNFMCLSKPQG